MKLWTSQPQEVCDAVLRDGVYHADKNRIPYLDDIPFRNGYDWLVREMEKRIGPRPEGVTYPVWAWAIYDGEAKAPGDRDSSDNRLLLCIDVPDDMVVLSDYDAWHYVLNDWYYDQSLSEDEYEEKWARFNRLPLIEQEKEKVLSWQGIFDTSRVDTEWAINGFYIQATFWELRKEHIISISSRNCPDT